MADIDRFTADCSPDLIGDSLERDGAVIVECFLEPSLVADINSEIEPLVAQADPEMAHLNPAISAFFANVRHLTGLAGKSKRFAEDVMCHPLYLALCDRFLLPSCAEYRLNLGHLMERGPKAERQVLHRDHDVWPHMPKPHPELQLASVVALGDFTQENGATVVVPGSHRWPADRSAQEHEVACARMPAGSAVIYLGSTLHAGGANSTASEWRRGFHLSYTLGWLRTEENNVLAVPPDIARNLSSRAQRLLGYGVHDAIADGGGYLGMLNLRDPADLLMSGEL